MLKKSLHFCFYLSVSTFSKAFRIMCYREYLWLIFPVSHSSLDSSQVGSGGAFDVKIIQRAAEKPPDRQTNKEVNCLLTDLSSLNDFCGQYRQNNARSGCKVAWYQMMPSKDITSANLSLVLFIFVKTSTFFIQSVPSFFYTLNIPKMCSMPYTSYNESYT